VSDAVGRRTNSSTTVTIGDMVTRELWRSMMDVLLIVWIVAMIAVAVVGMIGDYESVTGIQFVVMLTGVFTIGIAGMLTVS
jgi:hypothetical protein